MGLETRPPPEGSPATDAGEAAPAESRAASPQPAPQAPTPSASAHEPPPKEEKADDLEAIKKAVDDAASVGGGLWLSYLFVLFYLAVAAGAVTHKDLFFENPVKLPFLGIELPLVAFFAFAPLIFLVVHAYTLVHLVMLTDKAKRYHQALHDPERNVTDMDRENLQWQLPSNIFIQFLAGPPKVRASLFGRLLRAIAWVTLAIAPVLLLLLMQIQFLPYHSGLVVWTQRGALVLDLALIWWLWGEILSGREIDGRSRLAAWLWPPLGLALSLAVLLFSVTVVTVPGEWQEGLSSWLILPSMDDWGKPASKTDARGDSWTASFRDWVLNAKRVSLNNWIFASGVDPATGRRRLPFSSTLVLPSLDLYEELKIDDRDKAKQRNFLFRARGRDLRGAIFDFATLPKVDFAAAKLQGARFEVAKLEGASFGCERDTQTDSDACTQLQGASLDFAQLQGASLQGARLQGAELQGASLQGAWLRNAHLQGASLFYARLQGASLERPRLQGARLQSASLQGAALDSAQLQGASLAGARLWGASLRNAQLQGASLKAADLSVTDLSDAYL